MKYRLINIICLLLLSIQTNNLIAKEIVFTAPPRETLEKGIKIYKPIADFLSKKLNQKVIYKQPGNWAVYRRTMTRNEYDIIFDGPHFISWREKKLSHVPVAMLPQPHVWIIIKRKDNKKITTLKDIEGKQFCGQQFPNFGTLTAMSHFDITREPGLVTFKGWKNVYNGVVAGKCAAGILPKTNLNKFDPKNEFIDIVHTHPAFPNQGFTVTNKFNPALISKIQMLLLSPEGQLAMENLRLRYSKGGELIKPKKNEYESVNAVLKNSYGFGFNFN